MGWSVGEKNVESFWYQGMGVSRGKRGVVAPLPTLGHHEAFNCVARKYSDRRIPLIMRLTARSTVQLLVDIAFLPFLYSSIPYTFLYT